MKKAIIFAIVMASMTSAFGQRYHHVARGYYPNMRSRVTALDYGMGVTAQAIDTIMPFNSTAYNTIDGYCSGHYLFKDDDMPIANDSEIWVFNEIGKLVCKATASRPMTDQEKIDWFKGTHKDDMPKGFYRINSPKGKTFLMN